MAAATSTQRDVSTHDGELAGMPVRWHEAPGPAPIVWLHGVPDNGLLWRPFLERVGGVAPDLPGFGASTKRGDLPFDLPFHVGWLREFLDARGIERFSLCGHDWGAAFAVALALAVPERVERLCLIDAVPLLEGYRWHRLARLWRTPVVGELAMGATTRWVARRILAASWQQGEPPPSYLDEVWQHFDDGTQRAILRLYRSADPAVLARAGAGIERLAGTPALIVHGERDPFIPPRFATALAVRLGTQARAHVLPGAGHWPWLEDPAAADEIAAFISG